MVLAELGTDESLIGYILSYPTMVTFLIFSFIIFCGFVATCIYRKISGKWIRSKFLIAGLFGICLIAVIACFSKVLSPTKLNVYCFCMILFQIPIYAGWGYAIFEKRVSAEYLLLRFSCLLEFIFASRIRSLVEIGKDAEWEVVFMFIWIIFACENMVFLIAELSPNSKHKLAKMRFFVNAKSFLDSVDLRWSTEPIIFAGAILNMILMILSVVSHMQ